MTNEEHEEILSTGINRQVTKVSINSHIFKANNTSKVGSSSSSSHIIRYNSLLTNDQDPEVANIFVAHYRLQPVKQSKKAIERRTTGQDRGKRATEWTQVHGHFYKLSQSIERTESNGIFKYKPGREWWQNHISQRFSRKASTWERLWTSTWRKHRLSICHCTVRFSHML